MEWLLSNPQIYSTFASLGTMQDDNTYSISEHCLEILDEINVKLLIEDHTLRTFRRAIGFGQNIKNDLIPLLIHGKDAKILDAIIRILVNLTVPIECLLSIEIMSKTDVGRHAIYELNQLLITSKEAFTDIKAIKSIVDYLKRILEKDTQLTTEQCVSVNNCLLLLRNILHIPEMTLFLKSTTNSGTENTNNENSSNSTNNNTKTTSMQNQIIWHLFTQSVDKILIYLMSCNTKSCYGTTMTQLIALIYKDQTYSALQNLLTNCFESAMEDSSDDNESNTTPPKQSSGGSSPMLTSDPTSDSSDNGKSGSTDKCMINDNQDARMPPHVFQMPIKRVNQHKSTSTKQPKSITSEMNPNNNKKSKKCSPSPSEFSDCGYGTQVENLESMSTSSNEDDCPKEKPIHHPPSNQKQRLNAANKQRNTATGVKQSEKKDWRKKKISKRSRSTL